MAPKQCGEEQKKIAVERQRAALAGNGRRKLCGWDGNSVIAEKCRWPRRLVSWLFNRGSNEKDKGWKDGLCFGDATSLTDCDWLQRQLKSVKIKEAILTDSDWLRLTSTAVDRLWLLRLLLNALTFCLRLRLTAFDKLDWLISSHDFNCLQLLDRIRLLFYTFYFRWLILTEFDRIQLTSFDFIRVWSPSTAFICFWLL